jgi:hypothetical protein
MPFNIADRKRNKLRGAVDWAPTDRTTLTFRGEVSRDDYSGKPLGLDKGKGYALGLDGSFQVSTDWSLNAWVSFDQTKAEENGLTIARTTLVLDATHENHLKENGFSFGAGVRGKVDKLKLGADLERFRSVNKYNQDVTPITAAGILNANLAPVPDITNKMLRRKAFAEYPIQKNAELRFNFVYEKWQTDDWTWNFAGGNPFQYCGTNSTAGGANCPATPTLTDGTTVFADQKQHSVFGGLRYIYRFE